MPVNLGGGSTSTPTAGGGQSVNVGQIFLQLNLQNNIAQQIGQQAQQSASQATQAFSGVGSTLSRMASMAMKAFSVAAIVKFGKECINIASNLEEVQNVVDTAFGDMAHMCEEFAKTADTQFGISELSAKRMASTFMSMSTGMGLSGEQAAKMSINVAKLSADVASFYNISSDLASIKLKAIWTGETEGLKDLGIVMTQVNLKNYAMSKGITKNIQDMTQAEQTILRYNYVMEQMSLAQGDFAKTSDSWSNSMKSMGEKLKVAMGNIGKILIDVFTPALKIISELVSKFAELTEKASEAYFKLFGKEQTDQAVKNIKTSGETMAEAVEESAAEVQKATLGLAGFDDLYTIGKSESSVDGSFASAFGNIEDYKEVENESESLLDKFLSKAQGIMQKLAPIGESIKSIIGSYMEIGKKAGEVLSNIFGDIDFKGILNGIIDAVIAFYQIVDKFIKQLVVPIFERLFQTIQTWWDEHGRQLFSNLLTMFQALGNFLKPFFNWLIDNVGPFIVHCFDNLMNGVDWLLGAFSGLLNFIIVFCESVFRAWHELFEVGIVQMLKDFIAWIAGIFVELWNIIKTPINWILEGVNKVIDALNSISVDVPDWVPGIGGQTWGFNIPNIPLLANGGIVDQPTLAVIGEGKHDEAVIPLDGRLEEIVAKAVATTMAALGMNKESEEKQQDLHLTVNLGSKNMINELINDINRQTRINGKSVIINR